MSYSRLSRPGIAAAAAVVLTAALVSGGPASGTVSDGPTPGVTPDAAVPPAPASASGGLSAAAAHAAAAVRPSGASITRHSMRTAGRARSDRPDRRNVAVTSAWTVSGYAAVGVTWNRGEELARTRLYVRTYDDRTWSRWHDLDAEDDDMPDLHSAESAGSRPGTAPLIVGDVDRVQAKVVSMRAQAPGGLSLAVIDPGTSQVDAATTLSPIPGASALLADARAPSGTVAQPQVNTRAQWGADEQLRSGEPRYGSVQTTFVHHTVNANDYAAEDVPAIIRSIYAYHTQGRGWSDIGYNVLVDRFGRLWEGRYGGLTASVVGAHTLNYNEDSFGVSAIGNFETVRPSDRMVDALARVLSWKLDLAGLPAKGSVTVDGDTFQLINGHRDAAATACPGGYLYAALPAIRTQAAALIDVAGAGDVGGRDLHRAANADNRPDAVVRDGSGLRAMLGDAGPGFRPGVGAGSKAGRLDTVTGVGDVDGDGTGDVLVRYRDTGAFQIRAADGEGGVSRVVHDGGTRFAGVSSLTGAADLTGDGRHDLILRMPDASVRVAAGRDTGFAPARTIGARWSSYVRVLGAGDLDADGLGDLLLVDPAGVLWSAPSRGDLGYGAPVRFGGGWSGRDHVVAGLDLTGDARADLMATDADSGLTWIRPGTAAGSFGAPIGGWAGWATARTVTATTDASGDRFADVVLVDAEGRMSVRESRHGMWLRPGALTTGSWSEYRYIGLVGDWDGDGAGDLAGISEDRLWIFPGVGKGAFGARTGGWQGFSGYGHVAGADDMDGDGSPDLISRSSSGEVWLHRGLGVDGVAAPVLLRAGAGAADAVLPAGLWNGDDLRDVVAVVDGRLQLWAGTDAGGLAAPAPLDSEPDLGRFRRLSGAGDLSGDGHPDLLAVTRTGTAYILPGSVGAVGTPIRVARNWS